MDCKLERNGCLHVLFPSMNTVHPSTHCDTSALHHTALPDLNAQVSWKHLSPTPLSLSKNVSKNLQTCYLALRAAFSGKFPIILTHVPGKRCPLLKKGCRPQGFSSNLSLSSPSRGHCAVACSKSCPGLPEALPWR